LSIEIYQHFLLFSACTTSQSFRILAQGEKCNNAIQQTTACHQTKPTQTCLHPEADEVVPSPIIGTYNFSSPVFIWKTILSFQCSLYLKTIIIYSYRHVFTIITT